MLGTTYACSLWLDHCSNPHKAEQLSVLTAKENPENTSKNGELRRPGGASSIISGYSQDARASLTNRDPFASVMAAISV
jgi:hypothetical protein